MSPNAALAEIASRISLQDENIYAGELQLYKNLEYICPVSWITKEGFIEEVSYGDGLKGRRVYLLFESQEDLVASIGRGEQWHIRCVEGKFAAPVEILLTAAKTDSDGKTIGSTVLCRGDLKS